MFKCPNCSGSLTFDIDSQKLRCLHCDSSFSIGEYNIKNNAQENVIDDMKVFTCLGCGAQLIAPDTSIVAFCSYCGSESILESRLQEYQRPYKLIPFKVNKDTCKNLYKAIVDKHFYAPKEFRDPQFLEKFRGIYIPYWNYDVTFEKDPIKIKGTASYSKADYHYEETYDLSTKIEGTYTGKFYDASSNFNDTIAEEIAPFNEKDFVDYDDSYLAGFYADRVDVPATTYEKGVKKTANDHGKASINKAYSSKNITPIFPNQTDKYDEFFGTTIKHTNVYLFPVWFLTWRKADRVAYAVVNGQTGNLSSDIPIDSKRFLFVSLGCGIILFALLTLFVSMTAPTALFISSLIAWLVSYFYRKEAMELHDRENHVFDKGYFVEGRDSSISKEKAEKIRKRRLSNSRLLARIGMICILVFIGIIYLFDFSGTLMPIEKAAFSCTLLLLPATWNFIRTISFVFHMEEKSIVLEALTCYIAIIVAWFILLFEPAQDYYYYIGCLICLLGVLITCFGLINKYNVLSTRSLPELFERKGARDNANH